ncbi:MAG: hypothetical protein QF766_02470 [Candidatus Poseidoniia archaeon]|jgi:hypothetical protein|nr:hypothetical protein [Euryarchaeota archaeon]MDP7243400.1 hypothetical protein [Candidatus Poseidoniia archaeon]MDP7535630.1 hypothetical protein [Candidatus Poseidoniia archaeon]MDP7607111.1 hypothetical protein [Candidatus Poseidoniia archaeon]HJP43716.1 hypothetical protein [Candidatus Poseidoniia archaeon]|tara:strand:- start:242 stop:853 length:612 start_codon:yes stop_codon:yes gene_type:complete
MDDSDLRLGGWNRPRRITLARILGLLVTVGLVVVLVGPQMVNPFTANVSNIEPLWQHTDETDSQEYNGLLKLRTQEYESVDGKTGLLYVIALSSLVPLADLPLDLEQTVADRVQEETELQQAELSNGRHAGSLSISQGHTAELLQWDASVTGTSGFFGWFKGSDLRVRAAYWEVEQGLVICVAFGTELVRIDEATRMVQSVQA